MTNAAIEISARSPSALGRQLGGLYAIWLREIKRAVRDRGQLVGGISRPLLWVVIMGIGLNPYFRGEIYGEVRFVVPYTYLQFIFPAVILLNVMYTSVQAAVSTIWDREFGFLREILVSPLWRGTILLGKILGGTTVAMFHGSLVLALARPIDQGGMCDPRRAGQTDNGGNQRSDPVAIDPEQRQARREARGWRRVDEPAFLQRLHALLQDAIGNLDALVVIDRTQPIDQLGLALVLVELSRDHALLMAQRIDHVHGEHHSVELRARCLLIGWRCCRTRCDVSERRQAPFLR